MPKVLKGVCVPCFSPVKLISISASRCLALRGSRGAGGDFLAPMADSNPFEFGPGSSVLRLALASQNARMAALQARSKAQDDDYRRMVADCKDMQLSAQELRAGRGGPSGPTKSPSRSPSHLRTRSQQEQIIDRLASQDAASLFDAIDADGSGTIDKEELGLYLVSAGIEQAEVDVLFKFLDADGSGDIDREEWWSGFSAFLAVGRDAKQLFDLIDEDGSGTIDSDELTRHLTAAGHGLEEIEAIFEFLDEDGDGSVDIDEWRRGFSSYVALVNDAGPASKTRQLVRSNSMHLEHCSPRKGVHLSSPNLFLVGLDEPLRVELTSGTIRLLDADALRTGALKHIAPRQSLEREQPSIFLAPEKATAILAYGARKVGVLTFPWRTRTDPDPDGQTLAALLRFLKSPDGQHIRGIFWDFPCLPQVPRTDVEEAQYLSGLARMGDLYASPVGTTVIRSASSIPPCPPQLAHLVIAHGPPAESETELRSVLRARGHPAKRLEFLDAHGFWKVEFHSRAKADAAVKMAAKKPLTLPTLVLPILFTPWYNSLPCNRPPFKPVGPTTDRLRTDRFRVASCPVSQMNREGGASSSRAWRRRPFPALCTTRGSSRALRRFLQSSSISTWTRGSPRQPHTKSRLRRRDTKAVSNSTDSASAAASSQRTETTRS